MVLQYYNKYLLANRGEWWVKQALHDTSVDTTEFNQKDADAACLVNCSFNIVSVQCISCYSDRRCSSHVYIIHHRQHHLNAVMPICLSSRKERREWNGQFKPLTFANHLCLLFSPHRCQPRPSLVCKAGCRSRVSVINTEGCVKAPPTDQETTVLTNGIDQKKETGNNNGYLKI